VGFFLLGALLGRVNLMVFWMFDAVDGWIGHVSRRNAHVCNAHRIC